MESALRPRDIQARIRAGETPEAVAAAAQTTVEAIMAFATPVLAERAHVASTAQRASVRRRSGQASAAGRTLGESVELFLADHELHDQDIEWDAWRRPDGRWVLVATYAVGGRARTAEFTHDLPGRYVVAENDEARILIGEVSEPGTSAATGSTRAAQARRLSSVPAQDELPLGDDAIELVRDREPADDEPEFQFEQPDGWSAATEDTDTADWIASDVPDDVPADVPADTTEDGAVDEPPTAEKPASSKKRSRSSVPSWDEIMFGGKND